MRVDHGLLLLRVVQLVQLLLQVGWRRHADRHTALGRHAAWGAGVRRGVRLQHDLRHLTLADTLQTTRVKSRPLLTTSNS